MTPRQRSFSDRDGGSVTLELTVLAPAILILLALVIVAGRIEVAHQVIDHAAQTAARAASLARDPATARAQALAAATTELRNGDLHCTGTRVTVDTTGFAIPVGRPAQVTVTVACTVTLDALSVPGIPGTRQETATATSPLDTYRART